MVDGIEVERMVESRPKKVNIFKPTFLSNCTEISMCGPSAKQRFVFGHFSKRFWIFFRAARSHEASATFLIILAIYGHKTKADHKC